MEELVEGYRYNGAVAQGVLHSLSTATPQEVASMLIEKHEWQELFPQFSYPDPPTLIASAYEYGNDELLEFLTELGWPTHYTGTKTQDPKDIVKESKKVNSPVVSFSLTKGYVVSVGLREILKHGIVPHVELLNESVATQLGLIKKGLVDEAEEWAYAFDNPRPLEEVKLWSYYNDPDSLRTPRRLILLSFVSPSEVSENFGLKKINYKRTRGNDYVQVSKISEGVYYLEDDVEAETLSYDVLEEFENFFELFGSLSGRTDSHLAEKCQDMLRLILKESRHLLTLLVSDFWRDNLEYTLKEAYYLFENNYFVRNTGRESQSKKEVYCGFFFGDDFPHRVDVRDLIAECGRQLGLDLIVVRNHYGSLGIVSVVFNCR
jgi:hypothetical protein